MYVIIKYRNTSTLIKTIKMKAVIVGLTPAVV